MEFISSEKIIEIQINVIKKSTYSEDQGMGGLLRDRGTLDYLVFHGSRKTDTIKKASWFLHELATRHPFFQGNKRTALFTATLILKMDEHEYQINCGDEEIAEFVEKIGRYESSLDEVEYWIREKIK